MKKVKYTDKDKNEGLVSVDKLNFRPSVYGVLIENNKILLSKNFSKYAFSGGGLELGESVDEALKREFWEETGLKIKVKDVICCESSFYYSDHDDKYYHSILMFYMVKRISGDLSVENFDEYEKEYAEIPEWADLKDVNELEFVGTIRGVEIINKAVKILESRK